MTPQPRSLSLPVVLLLLSITSASHAFTVAPIVESFGDQGDSTVDLSLSAFRDGVAGDLFFVTINLLEPASLTFGAINVVGSPFVQCCFEVTSIRLTDGDGNLIDFGTNSFAANPFSQPIQWLVEVPNLPVGEYALAVSGTGNTDTQFQGVRVDSPDFTVRLTTSSVPEPGLASGLTSALAFLAVAQLRRAGKSRSA